MTQWKNEAEARSAVKAMVADYYRQFKAPAPPSHPATE